MILNILFTEETHFTRDRVNNTRNCLLWDCDNPHGTVESNYQHRFSVNVWCGVVWCGVVWCGVVWCGVIGDQLIGLYIFPQRLTDDI